MELTLRYDIRAPDFSVPQAELFEACLQQCQWADELGFDSVNLLEHHGSPDGYNPSPLVLAAAVAARTKQIRIRVAALILPLHDPIRVAEDAAVVDQISRGRLELIIGAGYVPSEFEMMGRDLKDRFRLRNEGIEVLKRAWSGEPFEYRDRSVTVMPRPYRRPRPPIVLGGSSDAAARQAARIAGGFQPTLPQFMPAYRAECERLGRTPPPEDRPSLPAMFLHVSEDPDAAWEIIAPHALHEMNSYGRWLAEGDSAAAYHPVDDADALRSTGLYLVVTPEELVARARALGPAASLHLHPLMGGLDPEVSWSSLRLFESKVLPELRPAR